MLLLIKKEELQLLRKEVRILRQDVSRYQRVWKQQKKRADLLEQENYELEVQIKLLKKLITQLKTKLNSNRTHKNKLLGMIFKSNVKVVAETETKNKKDKQKRGGQKGHKGYGRKKPRKIDQEKLVYLTHCPECGDKVKQTDNTYERIVEDIPVLESIVTLYHIERQWCSNCQKEVRAVPAGTLEGFRIGLNTIIWILFHKYRLRTPLNRITESLKEQYNLELSQGAIQHILHQLKGRFNKKYQQIVQTIKEAQVKHGDETNW